MQLQWEAILLTGMETKANVMLYQNAKVMIHQNHLGGAQGQATEN